MPDLRSELSALANRFASDVLAAIREASLDEILAEGSAGPSPSRRPRAPHSAPTPRALAAAAARRPRVVGGRLVRRSAVDIQKTLEQVVALLKAMGSAGARSEEIQKSLKLDKRELPRVLQTGIAKKVLRSKGQKRATRYFAA
jgi:hypothetical protein